MKLSAKMVKMLNDQIALEANASNHYLAMASWCESAGYDGASAFFFAQSDEERQHMLKLIRFMNVRSAPAQIPQIKRPAGTFKSLEGMIKAALKNEQVVTAAIASIVEAASVEKDHTTFAFLQWFVNEQQQEEEKFEAILQKFDLIGRDGLAINEIDNILGSSAAVGGQAGQDQ